MPRTKSLAWAQLKIGIIAVIAIVLASMLVLAVGGQGGFFWERYSLITRFDNVQGMKSGAVVRVAGKDVGKVTDVRFAGAQVEVVLEVNEDMQPLITTDSRASIGSLSLLGEPIVEISPASTGEPLPNGAYLESTGSTGAIGDMAASAATTLDSMTRLVQDIRAGRGSVGKLFTDDALYQEIQGFVGAAENVAMHLQQGRGTLGKLVQDPAAYQAMEASFRNLERMTARINAGEGSLGRLLQDESLARSLSETSENVAALTGRVNKGEGTLGKLVTDDQLYARLNETAGRLEKLTSSLNQVTTGLAEGQGTAGQLLRDKQLYENMNSAASELKSLIADIRKDPQKFLNVKVSIF